MTPRDLKKWPILNLLEPDIFSKVYMVMVYGNLGNNAVIVTKDKMVYALDSTQNSTPVTGTLSKQLDVLCKKDIKTFAHGGGHVLALTRKGKVYSWGQNNYWELGEDPSSPNLAPCLIEKALSKELIVDIACGKQHSLALTADGKVFQWSSIYTSSDSIISSPIEVTISTANPRVAYIACSSLTCVAITNNGEVYSWGFNYMGQSRNEGQFYSNTYNSNMQTQPRKVSEFAGAVIEKVVCGSAHFLALCNEGGLYSWGKNNNGQLGLSDKTDRSTPVKLKAVEMGKVLDVAASYCSDISVAMAEGSRLFIWGACIGQSITVPQFTPLTSLHDAFLCYSSPRVMYKPLNVYDEYNEISVLDRLSAAFNDSSSSDLTIQVQGKPIYVHRAVLKISSQYFKTMFQDHWAENDQNVIEHKDFSYDVYRAFLKYLYTNEVDLPLENILELLNLAHRFLENELVNRCTEIIKRKTTIENVTTYYSTAIEYNDSDLEKSCLRFALMHTTAVIKTENFKKLEPSVMTRFISSIADAGGFKN